MNKKFAISFFICNSMLILSTFSPLFAQDFGFGDTIITTDTASSSPVTISGKVSADATGYFNDFSTDISDVSIGDLFSGKVNLSATGTYGEGFISLDLSSSDISVDEAYVGTFFGDFELEAGLRKLTWGRADSFGPLDVINPLNSATIYTTMAVSSDLNDVKIAVPLLHATYRIGAFSKVEAVFEPYFTPYTIASSGRWEPAQISLLESYGASLPDTSSLATLDHFQSGLRFTTTIGAVDLGIQYFYGYLPELAVDLDIDTTTYSYSYNLIYNRYHQIGIDCATILAGFNIRGELGANITSDLNGEDGSVYNPALVGSLGFDRELFGGITLNLQVNESVRLFNDGIGTDFFDIESDTDQTATEIIASISKYFLKGELETRASAIVEPEEQDFIIMPAMIWTKGNVSLTVAVGIIGGNSDGQLGQYSDNDFAKAALAFNF